MPDDVLGLLLVLAAAAPGFAYVASVEKRAPRRERSSLRELTEVVFVGSAASGLSLLLVIALLTSVHEFDAGQLRAFAQDPFVYLVSDPPSALFAVAFVLVTVLLAGTVAWQFGRLRYRSSAMKVDVHGSSIHKVLGASWKTHDIQLTVELNDGRRLVGYAAGYSPNAASPEESDLVIKGVWVGLDEAPSGLWHQAKLSPEHTHVNAHYALVRGGEWRLLYAKYKPRLEH